MKILFDLVTTQGRIGGAQEYVRTVFYKLLNELSSQNNIELIAAIDSSIGKYPYSDLSKESINNMGIKTIDLNGKRLSKVVHDEEIDTVFIGMAQEWGSRYDVEKLRCRVICVVHDICDEEYRNSKINWYLRLYTPWIFLKKIIRRLLGLDNYVTRMNNIVKMCNNNINTDLITVSNYSRFSIDYYLPSITNKIHVLYSPERQTAYEETIENTTLNDIISQKKKYYLFLSANRELKNARKTLSAFKTYSEKYDSKAYILTTGSISQQFENHIVLPYLTQSDLIHAYKHSYALIFSSFFEGFGYPPIEAMRFGVPVIASNVTSIPEILGDAAYYFSPFYESDIYKALVSFDDKEYKKYSEKSINRYEIINNRQINDLNKLINIIIRNN